MARKPAEKPADVVVTTEDLTSEEAKAEVEDAKYVKVKSPMGAVSEVPVEIKQALLDSGYKVTK